RIPRQLRAMAWQSTPLETFTSSAPPTFSICHCLRLRVRPITHRHITEVTAMLSSLSSTTVAPWFARPTLAAATSTRDSESLSTRNKTFPGKDRHALQTFRPITRLRRKSKPAWRLSQSLTLDYILQGQFSRALHLFPPDMRPCPIQTAVPAHCVLPPPT